MTADLLRVAVEWMLGERIPADAQGMSFVFERNVPTWVWFLVVVGACMIAFWSYRRISAGTAVISRAMRALLAVLRASTIVLLAVLIAGPSVRFERMRTERDRLIVLVDRSQSLLIEDGPAGASRTAQLVSLLESAEPTFAEIAREKDIDFVGFAGGAFSLKGRAEDEGSRGGFALPELGEPTGDRTDLDAAIRQGLSRAAGRPVSAVLVLSDGRSIVPVSADTIRRLERDSIKVFSVALGARDPVGDAAILAVNAPPRAFARDRIPVEVRIDRGGLQGDLSVRLVDASTGAEIDSKPLEADAGGSESVVTLDLVADRAGMRNVRVEIVSQRSDLVRENNVRSIGIEVIDRPIRVLYVEGTSRWEYRYLKNLLLREKDIESSVMLLSADRDFAQEGNMPIARLPRTKEEFGRYDLFVIGDVPSGFFSPEQLAVIRGEVSDRGAGLLWIGGDRSMPSTWEGTALADLMPFRPPLSVEARVGASLLQPTDVAERLGVLRLSDDESGWPEALGDRTLSWPRLRYVQSVPKSRLKPTAETLAEAVAVGATGQEPSPAVVRMRFGAGEIMYVATDEIWRWRYGQGERYPERFWIPLVRLLARESLAQEGARAVLSVTPARVAPGESVLLTLRLTDESTAADAPATVPVEVRDAAGAAIAVVDLVRQGAEATTMLPMDRVGSFRAVLADQSLGAGEVGFDVVRSDDELRRGDADHSALEGLAQRSGGKMLAGADLRELPPLLPARAREIDESTMRSLWDTSIAFAMLLMLLAIEWTGRRLLRLV
jgi:hypothetical protein